MAMEYAPGANEPFTPAYSIGWLGPLAANCCTCSGRSFSPPADKASSFYRRFLLPASLSLKKRSCHSVAVLACAEKHELEAQAVRAITSADNETRVKM